MVGEPIGPCPHCQAPLEPGYLGYASGLFWSRDRLNWWQSLIFVALRHGRFVVGSFGATPWFRRRAGHRCTICGALVIPSDS